VLLVLPPFLIFPRLGQPLLWQDEAETALLGARFSSTATRWRQASAIISDQPGRADLNASGVWIWEPLAAALRGRARLRPLRHLAWAADFRLRSRAGEPPGELRHADRASEIGACAATRSCWLLGSVPFSLHVRQCRYYAPLALASMLQLLGYLRLTREGRGGATLFCCGGIGVYYTVSSRSWSPRRLPCASTRSLYHAGADSGAVGILCGAIAAATLPFFIYTRSWSRNYQEVGYGFESVPRICPRSGPYLFKIHVYAWPR